MRAPHPNSARLRKLDSYPQGVARTPIRSEPSVLAYPQAETW